MTPHEAADVGVPAGDWQSIDTAPKDGTVVRAKYDDGTEDEVCWMQTRQCMLSSVARGAGERGPGWACPEIGYLPVDPPTHWKARASSPQTKEGV